MKWTKEDLKNLRSFRNRIDDDNIRCKEIIKKKLLTDRRLIHVLNNAELEKADAEPDDYFGKNIRPAYVIPETQTDTLNYVCYTVGFSDVPQWNKQVIKYLQIQFIILCHCDQLIDRETSLARHDLLAALIKDDFNLCLDFGDRIQIASDQEKVVDSKYVSRTLLFETMTDRDLVKYKNGQPTIVNHRMDEF